MSVESKYCRDCPRIEELEGDIQEMKVTEEKHYTELKSAIEKKRDNWEVRAFMIIMFLLQALLTLGIFVKK